jgi:hypothetical protein
MHRAIGEAELSNRLMILKIKKHFRGARNAAHLGPALIEGSGAVSGLELR